MAERVRSRSDEQPASLALTALTLVTAAVLVLVLLLVGFGGAPQTSLAGLPGSGLLVGWALPIGRLLQDLAAVATVGSLLYAGWLAPSRAGDLRRPARRALRAAAWSALAWAALAALGSLLTLADISGESLVGTVTSSTTNADGESLTVLDNLVTLDQSRSLLLMAALALLVAVSAARVTTSDGPLLVLVLALAALIPPTLTGHAATHSAHELAIVSLAGHVVAATVWVGGLAALLVFRRRSPAKDAFSVRRYSTVALACFVVTAVTGLVNAAIRLSGNDGLLAELFGSGYGVLVLVKLAALGVLGGFGWWHRRLTIDALAAGRPAAFRAFAGREVAVMVATIAVAVALSRTPTPAGEVGPVDPGRPVDPGHNHGAAVRVVPLDPPWLSAGQQPGLLLPGQDA